MGDKLDMALDDIVKTMKKPGGRGRGGRRGRGGGRGRGGRGRSNNRGNRTRGGQRGGRGRSFPRQSLQTKRPSLQTSGPPKLTVENLHVGVSDYDINELFSEFGAIKSAAIHYDRSGRSLGTGHVIFLNRNDAVKALRQYNGVHLDGRPMKISMEGGVISGIKQVSKGNIVKRLSGMPQGGRGRRGRGGRGGGRGRGRGGRGGSRPKPKTAEELDAEMDQFLQGKPKTAKDLDAELDTYVKEAAK